jgi:elongation of very long chain fatty acids protein 4
VTDSNQSHFDDQQDIANSDSLNTQAMAASMKKSQSDEGLCLTKVPQDTEKAFSAGIIVPLLGVVGYIVFLMKMSDEFKAEAEVVPYSDPFKKIWWSAPAFFTVAYLIMISVGPRLMKNREPFKIKPFIFVYNSYQCLFNLWTVYAMYSEVFHNPWFGGKIWGNSPQPNSNGFRIAFLVWVHYNNKFLELLDTVWMILRKKDEQVSFLHCYHHMLLIWAWFFVCKVEAGGDCYFGASINSFIHVIMYGYYTLALLNFPCPWKKWITNCQMLQFMLCLTHSIFVVIKGNMPIELPLAQGFVMVNMLVLFGQFYRKKYLNKGKGVKAETEEMNNSPVTKGDSKKAQ